MVSTYPKQNVRKMIRHLASALFRFLPIVVSVTGAVVPGSERAYAASAVSGAASTDVGSDWHIAGPFGGSATSITVDPNDSKTVWAGAMNSLLFRSTDGGANWTLLDFPKRHLSELSSILVDPSDSKHVLVGVLAADGGGLYESADGGSSWKLVNAIRDFGVRALAYAPGKHMRFAAGTLRGVYLSDDCGKTWSRVSDPENPEMQGITVVAFDPKDENTFYAGTSHLPWRTVDGGKTWTSIHEGMIDDSDVFSIYVNPSNPPNILASACSGIYSSQDRGGLWKKLAGIPNTSRRTHVIRQDPANSSVIYAGTTTGLYKSSDGGMHWRTLTGTQSNSIAFDPGNTQTLYTALQYEGIGKSDNGGEQIYPVNHGFVNRAISAVTQSGGRLMAIETQEGDSTGIFTSVDKGESWSQSAVGRGLAGVHLKALGGLLGDDKILIAGSSHGLYKTLDGGHIWKPLPVRVVTPPPAAPTTQSAKPAKPVERTKIVNGRKVTVRVPARSARVAKPKPSIREVSLSEVYAIYGYRSGEKNYFLAATDLGMLKSEDLGEHWLLADIPRATAVSAVYIGPGDSPVLVARAVSGLFVSKDAGEHWAELSFPRPASEINDVALPSVEGGAMLIATRTGLFRSAEDGQWTASLPGLPTSTVNSVLYAGDQTALAVQYGRLYQSDDAGRNWSEIHTSLPLTKIRQLWKPNATAKRIYGLTGDLGVIYRD